MAENKATESSFSLENESFVLTSKEVLDVLGLECGVCNEPFELKERPPKPLPCNHTFCLPCLMKLQVNDYADNFENAIHCPTCQREINYDSLTNLPNDHRIVRGMEAISKAKERFKKVCFKHDCQPLGFFCTKCEVAICSDCTVLCHKEADGHDVVDLGEELKANARRYNDMEKRCESRLRKLKPSDDTLSNIKSNLEYTGSQEMGKVEAHFKIYSELLEQRKEALITMVEDKVKKRTSDITEEGLRHREKMRKLQDSSDCFRASRESGDVRAIFKTGKDLIEQEKNIVDWDENTLCISYEFNPVHEETFLLELKRLGDVQEKVDPKLQRPHSRPLNPGLNGVSDHQRAATQGLTPSQQRATAQVVTPAHQRGPFRV